LNLDLTYIKRKTHKEAQTNYFRRESQQWRFFLDGYQFFQSPYVFGDLGGHSMTPLPGRCIDACLFVHPPKEFV